MPCPHCCSAKTTERSDRTTHGYRRFRCRGCGRGFNEFTTGLDRPLGMKRVGIWRCYRDSVAEEEIGGSLVHSSP
jgi:transposase-like protein